MFPTSGGSMQAGVKPTQVVRRVSYAGPIENVKVLSTSSTPEVVCSPDVKTATQIVRQSSFCGSKHNLNAPVLSDPSPRAAVPHAQLRTTYANVAGSEAKTIQSVNQDSLDDSIRVLNPKALPLFETPTMSKVQLALREEITRTCKDLVGDLEARLTVQIEEVKATACQALSALGTQSVQIESEDTEQCTKDGPESDDMDTMCNKVSFPAATLKKISDDVIERVNRDPRICQLVESHQALKESFNKLFDLIEAQAQSVSPKITQTKVKAEKDIALYDMMYDVKKSCKSIALEMRQLRQRRNQDVSETMLRFESLERKQETITKALLVDSAIAGNDVLLLAEEEEQSATKPNVDFDDGQLSMLSLMSLVSDAKVADAFPALAGLIKRYDCQPLLENDEAWGS